MIRLLSVALAAFFIASGAFAQNAGTVTSHAFAIGKGAGTTGYTSLLCSSAQLAVGQSAADPICRTISGDATLSAAGAITLATVNSNVGSFGSATQCTAVTVNAKGLITAASQTTCTPAVGSITGFGAGVATFLATPSSANLIAAVTDETGTGALVFGTSPSLTTPTIGSAGATYSGSTSGSTILKAAATASGTVTLPAATDTLIGKATTDTLTNKSFDTAGTGNTLRINGTIVNATSGSNNQVALTASPSFVTPDLGTPSAGVATNLTGTAAGLTAGHVTTNANLTGLVTSVGNATSFALGQLTASLGANVTMNNTANYFDGPSIAQGSTGTWWASGGVVVGDTGSSASILCKLWDGTTVIDSRMVNTPSASNTQSMVLSGFLASPAGNLRISCRDTTSTNGLILFNGTGNSKDSTISAFRIQ